MQPPVFFRIFSVDLVLLCYPNVTIVLQCLTFGSFLGIMRDVQKSNKSYKAVAYDV